MGRNKVRVRVVNSTHVNTGGRRRYQPAWAFTWPKAIVVLVLLGLAVQFWFLSLPLAALVGVVMYRERRDRRLSAAEQQRRELTHEEWKTATGYLHNEDREWLHDHTPHTH